MENRLLDFSIKVVKLLKKITNDQYGKHISMQLFRSATSCGANYQEACAGESKRDFIHKLQISLKEMRESVYWLKLINKMDYDDISEINVLLDETNQLSNMIAKSIVTAKKSMNR